jgi:Spy/CpxP family protein refolding chaperone
MSNVKLFLVLAFVMVCAAGAGVGMIVDQRLRPVPPVVDHPHGPLDALKPTPEQRAKMNVIWSAVKELRDKRFPMSRELTKNRDAQIVALLTPAQKADYDKIQEAYRNSLKESDDALREAVRKAEEQTLAMLTPEQRPHYYELRRLYGLPGGGGPRRGGGRNRERNHSTTQPATMPAAMTTSADSSVR